MAYELELPHDVVTDLNDFLDRFQGESRRLAHAALVAELLKLTVNPRLGVPVYGGPAESRLFYRFRIAVDRSSHDLQVAYRLNESAKSITAHGIQAVAK